MSLEEKVKNCRLCEISKLLPNLCNPVISKIEHKHIMIIGEAPGENEILLDSPFVGTCGQLLNKMLLEAGIQREWCYITNVVKCRPTNNGKKNRPPTKEEISNCKSYLIEEINSVRPEVIFSLGKVATHFSLTEYSGNKLNIKKNFKLEDYIGKKIGKVIPNYHPSYIMQYGKEKYIAAVNVFKGWKDG